MTLASLVAACSHRQGSSPAALSAAVQAAESVCHHTRTERGRKQWNTGDWTSQGIYVFLFMFASLIFVIHDCHDCYTWLPDCFSQVSLELATGNKDFASEKNKSKLAQRDTSPSQILPSPLRETTSRSQHVDTDREELPGISFKDPRLNVWSPQKPSPHPGLCTSPHKSRQQVEEDPEVLLHTLLMVPDGKNFTCGPTQAPNVYLNCKLWCDETARSVISWGRTNPCFNFVQVSPGDQVF